MRIESRADWNARPARASGRNTVTWAERTEFFVHHTDGPKTQSIRSIQDFHLDGRGWGDVGYNFLVDHEGRIFEGRGWLTVGAHCPNHNRSGIGVAFIGSNNPTEAAKKSIRWLYDEACRKAGRKLRKFGHGDRFATSCPGRLLQAWVDEGMPVDKPTTEPVRLPELQPGDASTHVVKLRKTLGAANQTSKVYDPTDADLVALVEQFKTTHKLGSDPVWTRECWDVLNRTEKS